MRILVTGARGLLGSEVVSLAKERGHEVVAAGRRELDVTEADAVDQVMRAYVPDWVVHCAAYTAVDRAEEEPEEALRVNREGTRNVVDAANAVGTRVAYVSTDYVFSGEGRIPYRPGDPTAPRGAYARSKAAGEEIATEGGALVVRAGWLYGGGADNFVRTILRRARAGEGLRVVDDQWGGPTWTRSAAGVLLELMERDADGIWHVADGGRATWAEVAVAAVEVAGVAVEVRGVSTESWGAMAPRPAYSVLDVSATERLLGRPMMDWRDALRAFLEEEGEVARGITMEPIEASGDHSHDRESP